MWKKNVSIAKAEILHTVLLRTFCWYIGSPVGQPFGTESLTKGFRVVYATFLGPLERIFADAMHTSEI